jgi:hypothetical protein
MHNKLYSKAIVADLYRRAQEEYRIVNQWLHPEYGSEYFENSLRHLNKAEALLELIENVVAFSTGGGVPVFNRDNHTIDQRLKSVEVWLMALEELVACNTSSERPLHQSFQPFKCPVCSSSYFGPIFAGKELVGRYCKGWPSGYDRSYIPCKGKHEEMYST